MLRGADDVTDELRVDVERDIEAQLALEFARRVPPAVIPEDATRDQVILIVRDAVAHTVRHTRSRTGGARECREEVYVNTRAGMRPRVLIPVVLLAPSAPAAAADS